MVRRAGLSISVVKISELTYTRRIDAECYQPVFLENIEFLKKKSKYSAVELGSLVTSLTGGATPLGADYPEDGVPFLRVQNIMQGYLDMSDVVFISSDVHDGELKRSQLRSGDVLLTITGMSYGKAAYIPSNFGNANINQHSVRMALKPDVLPEYLAMFLNSRFGKLQSDRKVTGDTRPALDYEEIRTMLIPVPPHSKQEIVQRKLHQAEKQRLLSLNLYSDAENLLTSELSLKNFELPNQDIATLNLSDVLNAGRVDAEYFHPQKAYTKEWLSKFPGKAVVDYFVSVRDIYNPPNRATGNSVLNFDLTHALNYFLDDDGEVVAENEIGSLKKHLMKNDIVVSRLRSYLKEISIVEVPEGTTAVGSSEFIVLRYVSKKLFPEALLVYLRSAPVQTILKWSQDGSNHPRFQENELLAIKVPDKVLKIQADIRKMIQEGIKAHREAKRLLGEAKAEVERLIEGK